MRRAPGPAMRPSSPTSPRSSTAISAVCGRRWRCLPIWLAGRSSIQTRRDAAAAAFRARGVVLATLTWVILQCYFRGDRMERSLGLESRPPFPKGHVLEPGDWSLLDPVRTRPKMWRGVPLR